VVEDEGAAVAIRMAYLEPGRVSMCRKVYEAYLEAAGLGMGEVEAAKARAAVIDLCGEEALYLILAERVEDCVVMGEEEVKKLMQERLTKVVVVDLALGEAYLLEKDEKGGWRRTLEI
jgi:hypothetical protein